ncbi:hypothetical protein SKAU_G00316360 [Synaphobranchus kaupii]|uniref:Uncharacterized protein n=1 Tax=Synaphobranchus kaupii TaxID=118154 RepID=A0A9Q1ILR7_SYNKA|nr:hypothetical protein SKAU_G00316360 [Synaphobranchus kaupii]
MTMMPSRCRTALHIVGTTLFAAVVLFGILLAYVTGYQFIHTEQAPPVLRVSTVPSWGCTCSCRASSPSWSTGGCGGSARPQLLRRSVALCIAAYQEDPDYLRKCLRSVRRLSFPRPEGGAGWWTATGRRTPT